MKLSPSIMLGKKGYPTRGFTLIEVIVVMAIITLIAALVIPAVKGIAGGVNITSVGEEISATINLARQRATTTSHNTSIRFYREGNATSDFKSYQIWEQKSLADTASWVAADKEQKLPLSLIASNDIKFSPLLNLTTKTANGRTWAEFYFTPSGSVAVPKASAFLTIHSTSATKTGGVVAGLPANFATVSIEPFNGRCRVFRP